MIPPLAGDGGSRHGGQKPKLSIADAEKEKWDASDAIIQKRDDELERIWSECNARGQEAIQGVMDYIATIEGQNRRLNRRIDMIEAQVRFMDRIALIEERISRLQTKMCNDE